MAIQPNHNPHIHKLGADVYCTCYLKTTERQLAEDNIWFKTHYVMIETTFIW